MDYNNPFFTWKKSMLCVGLLTWNQPISLHLHSQIMGQAIQSFSLLPTLSDHKPLFQFVTHMPWVSFAANNLPGLFYFTAAMRVCMGSRRGFICRIKVGNLGPDAMASGHLNRLKQRNSLGPSKDGHNYAVIHCTGFIKNWPPSGQFDNPLAGIVSIFSLS